MASDRCRDALASLEKECPTDRRGRATVVMCHARELQRNGVNPSDAMKRGWKFLKGRCQ